MGLDVEAHSETGSYEFRAGNYLAVADWMDQLRRLVASAPGRPFARLLQYTVDETIGTAQCVTLARDFDTWWPRAVEFAETLEDGDWWLEKYKHWRRAFTVARAGGQLRLC